MASAQVIRVHDEIDCASFTFRSKDLFVHLVSGSAAQRIHLLVSTISTACTVLHTRAAQYIIYGNTVLNKAHPPGRTRYHGSDLYVGIGMVKNYCLYKWYGRYSAKKGQKLSQPTPN